MSNNLATEAPICACGICGQKVKWSVWKKRWNRFIKGHSSSIEPTRSKISKANKDRFKDNSELKKQRSEQLIKLYAESPTYRENQRKAQKKRYEDPEEVRQSRLSQIKRYEDPAQKEKQRLAKIKSYKENPAIREKQSQTRKKFYKNPDELKRLSDIIKQSYIDNPELKNIRSLQNVRNWEDPNFVKKITIGLNAYPNKPEKLILALTPEKVKYVGNGKFWKLLTIKTPNGIIAKRKNPDFIVEGQNKVIEFNGSYFHKHDYPDEIWIEAWANIGYELLIIWEYELKDIDSVLNRIAKFIGQDTWQMALPI